MRLDIMRVFFIWASASFFVMVVGEPPSSYTNNQPWGHIGQVSEDYSGYNAGKPGSNYGPPKSEYGPPKSEYGPPKSEYGPPRSEYGPPKSEYGPPKSGYGAPVKGGYDTPKVHSYYTNVVVKRPRKVIKGKYIWVPTIPRLKIIRPKIHFRAPKVKVYPPQLKFSPPRFVWW